MCSLKLYTLYTISCKLHLMTISVYSSLAAYHMVWPHATTLRLGDDDCGSLIPICLVHFETTSEPSGLDGNVCLSILA